MSFHVPLLLTLFGAAVLVPFMPGIKELRRPRDNASLPIDSDYVRNPRQFAIALRRLLMEQALQAPGAAAARLPNGERVATRRDLRVRADETVKGIVGVSRDLDAAAGASIQEAWVWGDATLGARVRIRGLACDGRLVLGPDCKVGRWIDCEHDVDVGTGCDLGTSATAVGTLSVASGSTFRRLWGQPVRTLGTPSTESDAEAQVTVGEDVIWAADGLSVPGGRVFGSGIVAHGPVRIGSGAIVRGPVKAEGDLVIGDGARIEGNVICRGSVRIGSGARVDGNVFAERDVSVGSGASIGRHGAFKTIYAARTVVLGPGVTVHGWIVADRGGKVQEG